MALRVLFLHSTWEDTSEYYVHRILAEHVAPERVDPFFIWQRRTQNAEKQRLPLLQRPDRIWLHEFGREMWIKPRPGKLKRAAMVLGRLPAALGFVARKIHQIKPDLLYTSQQRHEVLLGHLMSRMFGIPHCIHISYPVGPWLGPEVTAVMRRTRHLIACSDFVRESALKIGIAPERVATLHHGIDLDSYKLPRNPAYLRAQLQLSDDTQIITIAGRLDRGKGHMLLLEALAQIIRVMPKVHVFAPGLNTTGDSYDQVIFQRTRELGLEQYVTFAGFRTDLPQVFSGSDIFCMPTELDALPLVFPMAMASGLPAVGIRSGGIPEMIVDGRTGYIVEPGNADELAERLLRLLCDPAHARALGDEARLRAVEEYSPDLVSSRWADLLYSRLQPLMADRVSRQGQVASMVAMLYTISQYQ